MIRNVLKPLGSVRVAFALAAGLPVFILSNAFAQAPEAFRLALRGEGLATPHGATVWGLAVDGRVRLGLRLARIVPFIYADTSFALTTARVTLDNRPDSVTLSRWGFAAGGGLLFSFGTPEG